MILPFDKTGRLHSQEFGWDVYKFLGADRRLKRMFLQYQIFICCCKFDLFFVFGFSLQMIILVLQEKDWEYYLTIVAFPISIALLLVGWLSARKEFRIGMVSELDLPIYVFFLLIIIDFLFMR